jgi:uncharacterized protein
MKPLDLKTALEGLKRHKEDFANAYGVTRIGLFGSVARGESTESSDVDVVVEIREPDLFCLVHIKNALAEEFERPIDLVTLRDTMNRHLKERIAREAVYA